METLTINLSAENLTKLQQTASQLNLSVEQLLQISIESLIKQSEQPFQTAADYVLQKNAELYQRLA